MVLIGVVALLLWLATLVTTAVTFSWLFVVVVAGILAAIIFFTLRAAELMLVVIELVLSWNLQIEIN